jgi:nucleoside-diphosphate-sugar epimerase
VIAVTGATGHLGQWVVARLTDLGADVLVVSRRPKTAPTIEGITWRRPVRTLSWDLTEPASLSETVPMLQQAEAAIHLAAFIPPETAGNREWISTLRANVHGTIHLLQALNDSPALRSLVLASSFEVYGRPLELPIAETHRTRPTTYYGASKLAAEQFVRIFANDAEVACSAAPRSGCRRFTAPATGLPARSGTSFKRRSRASLLRSMATAATYGI